MLKLQDAPEESIVEQTGSDTDAGDDSLWDPESRRAHRFKLPRRFRGWLFLLRSGIRQTDWVHILQSASGSYDFKKI